VDRDLAGWALGHQAALVLALVFARRVVPDSDHTVELTIAARFSYAGGLRVSASRYTTVGCEALCNDRPSTHNEEPRVSDTVQIRPVKHEDFDAWLPLWDAYNAFYGRSNETALPRDITRLTWGRFFDAYEPMHAMVAERSGQLVGIVHFLYHRHTTLAGPICYLQDLYTLESERGKGVGRALIEAVYARAKADGSQRVYWQTHETNHTAMRLYDTVADKSGFVVYRKQM
jgi:GNAT superfamily N-acetyltransferase